MKRFLLAALLAAPPAAAQTPDPRVNVVEGSRVIVVDGDTIWLPCVTRARGCAEKVRLANIDAPETFRPRCEGELVIGLRAKEQLKARLVGTLVTIDRSERGTHRCLDPFGRTLAYVSTPQGDVGEWLIKQGLAEPWRPGKRAAEARRAAWCGAAPQ